MSKIFVFGSNTGGVHGAGAAAHAYKNLGARWGFSYGHMGDTFAIPTKGHITRPEFGTVTRKYVGDTLPLEAIEMFVHGFFAYAATHPELEFQVTAIGCGLAGLNHADIAPMFRKDRMDTLPNVWFDELWKPYLCAHAKFWGTF